MREPSQDLASQVPQKNQTNQKAAARPARDQIFSCDRLYKFALNAPLPPAEKLAFILIASRDFEEDPGASLVSIELTLGIPEVVARKIINSLLKSGLIQSRSSNDREELLFIPNELFPLLDGYFYCSMMAFEFKSLAFKYTDLLNSELDFYSQSILAEIEAQNISVDSLKGSKDLLYKKLCKWRERELERKNGPA